MNNDVIYEFSLDRVNNLIKIIINQELPKTQRYSCAIHCAKYLKSFTELQQRSFIAAFHVLSPFLEKQEKKQLDYWIKNPFSLEEMETDTEE